MRTNFNFTQLDKYQLSSPGAPLSPTSLVMHHSKVFLLDQVTTCYTLRLPLPRGDSVIDNCLHLCYCYILLQGCPGRERAGMGGLLWHSVARPGRALQNFYQPPRAWTLTLQPGLPVPKRAGKESSCAPGKRGWDWQSHRKSQVEMVIKNTLLYKI